jgi:hypothetical protein
MKNDSTEYVLALETHNAGDIAFIRSLLDSENIIYFVQGEHVSPYLFNALPMRVMVKKDQAEEVEAILQDVKLSYSYNFGNSKENTNDK